MRILAISDWGNTGINESLRLPLRHFHDAGHEIWHLALGYNGWLAGVDREQYPWAERLLRINATSMEDRFGARDIGQALEWSKADVVITSFDVWMVNYLCDPKNHSIIAEDERLMALVSHDQRSFAHVGYFPLDGATKGGHLPRYLDEWIAGIDVPVTYSRFAQNIVRRSTGLEIPFIPICHDGSVYRPGDRSAARRESNISDDRFLIGMVATNQFRKLWNEFIEAASRVAKRHSDVMILPWTTWDIQIAGGFDVRDLIFRSGVDPAQIVDPQDAVGRITDQQMANLYRSIDVLVLTTVGEGAGLPPIRARACGTPALVSDNTSNTEFTAHPFERIPVRDSFLDGANMERFLTNVDILEERLERLYEDRDLVREIGAAGAEAMKQYEAEAVAPMWDAVLGAI